MGPAAAASLRALREVTALSSPVVRERISIDIRDWGAGPETVLGAGKRKIEQMEEGCDLAAEKAH